MSTVDKLTSEFTHLKPEYQVEVLDFVEFLKRKQDRKEEKALQDFSLSSAMRGMEDEPDLYTGQKGGGPSFHDFGGGSRPVK